MEEKEKRGISGSTIKTIAILAMFIDHIGAGVLERYMNLNQISFSLTEKMGMEALYWFMRGIGRIGFPIFCFLLVEGFVHTRNVKKYAARLFAFCLISEIPFDLLFNGKLLEFGYQNVFFTLLIGLLTMCALRAVEKQTWNGIGKIICYFLVLLAGMWLADFLRTDYGANGVFTIIALYAFRKNKVTQIIAGCISFLWELPALFAFIPIGFYNGTRGRELKYFFYIFYPAHLLFLYLVCVALGWA